MVMNKALELNIPNYENFILKLSSSCSHEILYSYEQRSCNFVAFSCQLFSSTNTVKILFFSLFENRDAIRGSNCTL